MEQVFFIAKNMLHAHARDIYKVYHHCTPHAAGKKAPQIIPNPFHSCTLRRLLLTAIGDIHCA